MYGTDPRIVLTLDAGGTNLVFSAIAGNREIVGPIHFHSEPEDLDRMLSTLVEGFEAVRRQLPGALRGDPDASGHRRIYSRCDRLNRIRRSRSCDRRQCIPYLHKTLRG